MKTEIMNRNSPFSYHCNACGRCCVNKRIQTNPYEVLRLAHNLGMKTGEFVRQYLDTEGPYLRVTAEGACIFLDNKGCGVHQDRPIACRTYPLGRWVSANFEETYRELKPHPECEGEYGRDGTIGQFLIEQEVLPYLEAADRYQALFYRMFDALQQILPIDSDLPGDAQTAMFTGGQADMPAFMEWLDIDGAVEKYCKEHKLVPPDAIVEIMDLHIQAIDQWLDSQSGGTP
jgi:uncharacterized protein